MKIVNFTHVSFALLLFSTVAQSSEMELQKQQNDSKAAALLGPRAAEPDLVECNGVLIPREMRNKCIKRYVCGVITAGLCCTALILTMKHYCLDVACPTPTNSTIPIHNNTLNAAGGISARYDSVNARASQHAQAPRLLAKIQKHTYQRMPKQSKHAQQNRTLQQMQKRSNKSHNGRR